MSLLRLAHRRYETGKTFPLGNSQILFRTPSECIFRIWFILIITFLFIRTKTESGSTVSKYRNGLSTV